MKLEVLRYSSQNETTLGMFFDITDVRKFLCYTLEDECRTVKKYGETRIPAGTYKMQLRNEGGFHGRYIKKFGIPFHKGMLEVKDVPGFNYILIHIGNRDDNTDGCLLVGDSSFQNITEEGFIGSSTQAYKRIYPEIARSLLNGQNVWITYTDFDKAYVG